MAFNADQVIPGLWQGSAPPDADWRDRWDVVVLAAAEWQPEMHARRAVLRVPLDDARLSTTEAQLALRASKAVAEAVRRGESVLVTCHMGLNRSGLISALALRRLGYSANDAIAAVRRARGDYALSNESFVSFIKRA
jgi:protein-tyrosine phosphatase